MDFINQYLQRSQEIIGDRTREEVRYDKEVLRWLRKGKKIKDHPEETVRVLCWKIGNLPEEKLEASSVE